MAHIMMQFRQKGKSPTLEEVRTMFGLHANEVDADFGVQQTDTQDGLFTILVDEAATERIREKLAAMGADAIPAVGVFSNPRIEPFGPPAREA